MIYTIIEDLLPSNHICKDVFNDDSYLIDTIEVATVPDGSGSTLPATIDNRWEWTNSTDPNVSVDHSTSGNRFMYTVTKPGAVGVGTYFDYSHGITAPYGIFPITDVVSGFGPTFQIESLFSKFSVPSGSSVSGTSRIYTPGIFIKVGTNNYCTLKIIYDSYASTPGTVELQADVFNLPNTYHYFLANITLPVPPVIGIGLRITYKNIINRTTKKIHEYLSFFLIEK